MAKFTKIFLLTVGLILIFGAVALAQNETTADEEVALDETVEASDLEVSEPILLPDSSFYFLKNWGRGIRSFFTFGAVNKANLSAKYASEKLLEARKLAEKVKDPEIIKKAAENYEKEVNRVKAIADKIKDTATENPKVGEFLDKFIKQQILHQKILEKLEEQVPQEVLEKIKEVKERHLQKFGEVMEKLEEKTKIAERLEKNLEELKGSEFKQFKNLEILKKLEEKVPEETKEAIRETRENIFRQLKEKLEEMSTTTQENFKEYAEKIKGEVENKLEIIQDLQSALKEKLQIRERLENIKEKILEKLPEQIQERQRECPMAFMPPAPDFCKEGRIVIERDEKGCPLPPRCIIPGEVQCEAYITCLEGYIPYDTGERDSQGCPIKKCIKREEVEVEEPRIACITIWDPVCGVDGKTYSNVCWTKVADVEIAHKGVCKEVTCEEKCQSLGYFGGICRTWAISSEGLKEAGCKDNEISVGYTSDCTLQGAGGKMIIGVGKACCCQKSD